MIILIIVKRLGLGLKILNRGELLLGQQFAQIGTGVLRLYVQDLIEEAFGLVPPAVLQGQLAPAEVAGCVGRSLHLNGAALHLNLARDLHGALDLHLAGDLLDLLLGPSGGILRAAVFALKDAAGFPHQLPAADLALQFGRHVPSP